jgi:hypothetical protein
MLVPVVCDPLIEEGQAAGALTASPQRLSTTALILCNDFLSRQPSLESLQRLYSRVTTFYEKLLSHTLLVRRLQPVSHLAGETTTT